MHEGARHDLNASMNTVGKSKVFVGLSGGVDSSVAALLLKEQGYEVTGVFIKVWDAPWLPCDWREERRSAMRVAAHLRIPFKTLDLEEEYKKGVVDYMVNEYSAGRIPNPDVMCNKVVKFGGFAEWAFEQGADFVATGHYARGGEGELLTARDIAKEQSYFLWNMPKSSLKRTLFPIGDLPKSEVRKIAEKNGLATATKKDSQGLCFLGPVDIPTFLSHYVECLPGKVIDLNGDVIGEHNGALLYTVGQRHGFRVTKRSPDSPALFVVSKDMEKNTITVAKKNDKSSLARGVVLEQLNKLSSWPEDTEVVIRYHGDRVSARLKENVVEFLEEVSDVAPGQSCVLYSGEVCLGGGIISDVLYSSHD